jgi:hypothetical protein
MGCNEADDMITDEELAELPSDPEIAFVAVEKICGMHSIGANLTQETMTIALIRIALNI